MNRYKEILKNCYRKYKSCVYQQNSLVYQKQLIADFESDLNIFEKRISDLADALMNKDNNYFRSLIDEINTVVLPKKIIESKSSNVRENIINRGSVAISEVNFYFDAPVELFVLDVFITMEIGSLVTWKKCWYANTLHRELLDETGKPVYNNLNLFSYYFTQYKKWKNEAIDSSQQLFEAGIDSSIISLDITGYYYHIDANIFKILENNNIEVKDTNVLFAIRVMQNAFKQYTSILKTMRADIAFDFCLPIGLNLSCLLSNLYLREFDDSMESQTVHYGRYVDDIIFVIPGCKYNKFEEYIKENNAFVEKESKFYFKSNPELFVKTNKCRIIKNYASGSNDIFKKLRTEEYTVSEFRLFPNFTTNVDDLLEGVFEKQDYIKFRDFEDIRVDKTKINRTIYGLILSTKGTRYKDDKELTEFSFNFLSRLTNEDIVLLWSRWDRLFFLFDRIDNKKKNCFDSFYDLTKNIYKCISFQPDENGDLLYKTSVLSKKRIVKYVKEALQRIFYNSVFSLYALTGSHKHIRSKNHLIAIKNFRFSNMFNIGAVNYPLINYLNKISNTIDFSKITFSYYIDNILNGFDSFKIRFSPVFINLNDYILAMELNSLFHNEKYDLKKIHSDYYSLIGCNYGLNYLPLNIVPAQDDDYCFEKINISNLSTPVLNINRSNIKIAVAGIDLDKLGIVYKSKKGDDKLKLSIGDLRFSHKTKVIRLLNESYYRDFNINVTNIINSNKKEKKKEDVQLPEESNRKEPVNYIVFPESFLPISWIHLFDKFAKETQSTIISGIRYVIYKGRAYNLVSVHIPFYDAHFHRQSIILLRKKNVIPLYEKNIINDTKLAIDNNHPNYYFLVTKDDMCFCPLICYEATDIKVRALLKDDVDYVFTIAYNKDTKYFNSIGMSTSRDLFCFYVECNSSLYGSSSYAPYRNEYLPIAADKGNSRDHMHIISTDLQSLYSYKDGYDSAYLRCERYDFVESKTPVEDKEKAKFKKPSANTK